MENGRGRKTRVREREIENIDRSEIELYKDIGGGEKRMYMRPFKYYVIRMFAF